MSYEFKNTFVVRKGGPFSYYCEIANVSGDETGIGIWCGSSSENDGHVILSKEEARRLIAGLCGLLGDSDPLAF